ncbi:MAG: Anaerobic sulfatase-maturating enzyme [Candidatus Lokiarchaeum sp. GC14_75]|nr:MAG: Anaerobic sulfatase-maturating enzyme [Candidatus Lokiarchaeum sp. GC14_75]
MKSFSLLIKPASADCNLRCQYCFYIDHLKIAENHPRMSENILDSMIEGYLQTNQNNNYAFGWQGGEPTLMGLKFFKKVVELQTKHAPPNAVISNGLQTNGTLITNEMAEFFAEYKFLLGVSLDGPEHLHDFYRKTISRKPTHSLVLRGINRLKKYNVEFNILTLINNNTVKKASEIYQYLKSQGFFYHQYIPCVEFDEKGKPKPFSITGADWGDFLCDLFEEWIKEDITKISIRLFDSILNYLVSGTYSVCFMGNNCCQYFVVEYDGKVYPCDFFVRKDLLLGNVKTHSWGDFFESPTFHTFGIQKARFNKMCKNCPFINLCHGDCQKHRHNLPKSSQSLSILCKGWKKFYVNCLPQFKVLVEQIMSNKELNSSFQIKVKKIGRNSICPCKSGKKYKECCLR